MKYYRIQTKVFSDHYLHKLWGKINASPYFTINNLNRDFVQTKGFSLIFRRDGLPIIEQKFSYFMPYLEIALQPECNAFYLNPLLLTEGSRVDPHIDRSLRSYCKVIDPPLLVSVLYVRIPEQMSGGELILRSRKQQIGRISPQENTLVYFQGNLTHSITPVKTDGSRLSLVCEQYMLTEAELEDIPRFTLESRINS
ncbi:MAG: 2OG-Fe(II) oxygenase [Synechococcaceae cyanobacterium SM2_3_1]|nr:2OG-Fe(II) oxygenase [Synechococcaceae cyanobacterium SM2_3_1]